MARLETISDAPIGTLEADEADSRVSELLSGKRKLTLDMIRRLHKALSLPLEVLIQDY